MELTAKDIMVKEFPKIHPDAPVNEAARMIFKGPVRETGYKPFGMVVTDDIGRLVGMVSMHDILYHLRPSFMNYEASNTTIWEGELEPYLNQFKELSVDQIMSSPVLTASPDCHLMVLIDMMVKNRVRRIPIIEDNHILGIVYLSDVYYHLFKVWLGENEETD
jgi:CBS domain-containing protein